MATALKVHQVMIVSATPPLEAVRLSDELDDD